MGLAGTLHIKLNARVILTINVDLQDRLVNGQLGTIKHIVLNPQNNVSKICIKFDDCKAGLKNINTDNFAANIYGCSYCKTNVGIRIKPNKNSSPVIKTTSI